MNYLNDVYFTKNEQLTLWNEHIKRYRLQLLLLLPNSLRELFLQPSSVKGSYTDYGVAYTIRIAFYYRFEKVTFEQYVWKEEKDHTGFWHWGILKNDEPVHQYHEQLDEKTKDMLSGLLLSFGHTFEPTSEQEKLISKAFSVDEYNDWEKEQWIMIMKSYQKQKKKKSYKKIKTNS